VGASKLEELDLGGLVVLVRVDLDNVVFVLVLLPEEFRGERSVRWSERRRRERERSFVHADRSIKETMTTTTKYVPLLRHSVVDFEVDGRLFGLWFFLSAHGR
jgi:hypothetical protein